MTTNLDIPPGITRRMHRHDPPRLTEQERRLISIVVYGRKNTGMSKDYIDCEWKTVLIKWLNYKMIDECCEISDEGFVDFLEFWGEMQKEPGARLRHILANGYVPDQFLKDGTNGTR